LLASDIRSHRHWVAYMVAGALIGNIVAENAEDTGPSATWLFPSSTGGRVALNL